MYQSASERKPNHGRKRKYAPNAAGDQDQRRNRQRQTEGDVLESASFDPSEDSGPQSRTLLSSKFQKLYVGSASSLSYLQFVREIVNRCIGINPFSQGEFSSFMLESDVRARVAASEAVDTASPRHQEPVLVQSYLDAVRF